MININVCNKPSELKTTNFSFSWFGITLVGSKYSELIKLDTPKRICSGSCLKRPMDQIFLIFALK